MKNAIVFVLLIGAFGNRISGQTPQPMVITSDYYAGPKTLIVHALNNSGKDIIGYSLVIRPRNPNGTVDKGSGSTTNMWDMLSSLIVAQMAKDPAASADIRSQNAGMEAMPAGFGIFKAGETRDMTVNGIESASEFDISAGVVFYADGSFDKQDEESSSFKQMLAGRQGSLLAMKKTNEAIKGALADPANEHPAATAIADLTKYVVENSAKQQHGFADPEVNERRSLQNDIQALLAMQQPQKGTTERERLMQYVEEQNKRIELMTPHCHLEIDLKK